MEIFYPYSIHQLVCVREAHHVLCGEHIESLCIV